MDISSITAAVGSLKAAGDIAKGLIGLHTMTEVQTVAIELNQKLISAQHEIFAVNAAQSAMVDRIRDLEKQIANMEAWETQKQRYQLAKLHTGSLVHALKKSMSNGEPAHYLCTRCYEDRKRSILQGAPSKRTNRDYAFVCPVCGSEALNGYSGPSDLQFAEDMLGQ